MIVQIYTMQTPAEADAVVRLGVDHIGITPAQQGLPGEISLATARDIVETVGDRATSVALSVDENLDAIVAMVRTVRPHILHLCGDIEKVSPAAVAHLRGCLPKVRIMQAIPMTGPEAVAYAAAFEPVADYLILDSVAAHIGGIGAAGTTHDWSISRKITARSSIPVVLAGGLAPHNVADAIHAVRPWGVDSLSHTNQWAGDGTFRKDLDKIAAFVDKARRTGEPAPVTS